MQKRLTRKNPNVNTYRLPLMTNSGFRAENQGGQLTLFGDLVDKLGRYEDLGEPEELTKK